jgi:hypothetical protein
MLSVAKHHVSAKNVSAFLRLPTLVELKIDTAPTGLCLCAFQWALVGGASLALIAGWTASQLTVIHYSKLI